VAVAALLMENKKIRPFIKYNAVQALAFTVVLYILGAITAGGLYAIGSVYAIVLAIQAYQGKWANVPLLTDFIKKQKWV
jgi:uncharacterized membrane protein